jgi:hypothetical protein
MEEVIGKIGDVEIHKYDVVEVSDDGGKTWLDFATIKDSSDVYYAGRIVREGGGFGGHRRAKYRIKRSWDHILVS